MSCITSVATAPCPHKQKVTQRTGMIDHTHGDSDEQTTDEHAAFEFLAALHGHEANHELGLGQTADTHTRMSDVTSVYFIAANRPRASSSIPDGPALGTCRAHVVPKLPSATLASVKPICTHNYINRTAGTPCEMNMMHACNVSVYITP